MGSNASLKSINIDIYLFTGSKDKYKNGNAFNFKNRLIHVLLL